jgi:putative SOS response-associated peptidase YedK
MCGRYTLVSPAAKVQEHFGIEVNPDLLAPTYNAAPSQKLPVITNTNPEGISLYRWGLIPAWAKDAAIGYKMINARAETLTEKPAFRALLGRKRCLVIADGFYEWQGKGKAKQPYRIMLKGGELFAMAGLWDEWKNAEGEMVRSFTVITTEPNSLMVPLHNRMPAILAPQAYSTWLNTDAQADDVLQLLGPYQAEAMEAYPVSGEVGSPSHNYPELINPVTL